jgi:hypothetical protein
MPSDRPETKLPAVVHITKDLLLDLDALYALIDGEEADQVRDGLVKLIRKMQRNDIEWSLVEPYGKTGTTMAYGFSDRFILTFRSITHFDQDRPVEEHYFLKNLFGKE